MKEMKDMSLEEFFNIIERDPLGFAEIIVRLAYRHSDNEEYEISNEHLSWDGKGAWIWENDWNEGQKDVRVLGFIHVENVEINGFDFYEEV